MRSTSERVKAIEIRARELRAAQQKKRHTLLTVCTCAFSLALILMIAALLPGIMTQPADTAAEGTAVEGSAFFTTGAAAGIFAPGNVSGYVLIGLVAFVLGCLVTILCYRSRPDNRADNDTAQPQEAPYDRAD